MTAQAEQAATEKPSMRLPRDRLAKTWADLQQHGSAS